MTTNLRRIGASLLATAGALAALSVAAPAEAMSLPESGPTHLEPAGPTRTYDSRSYEEAVAACMTRRGFDYEPYLYKVQVTPLRGDGGDGKTIAISTDTFIGGEDPNEAIVAGLGVGERVAYYRALNGPDNSLDEQGYPTGRSVTISDASCGGRAG
jgi:hypothetical protein